jgi:hypothetical protein
MVARTRISDAYRTRAHALVALARSRRPTEAMPGARTWVEAQASDLEALSGLRGHLAIQPPPDGGGDGSLPEGPVPSAPWRPPGGERLRLAVAATAGDGDQAATAALVREGERRGLDAGELLAVAEQHWPKPRVPVRAFRAGRRWTAARLRQLHRPYRQSHVLAGRELQR